MEEHTDAGGASAMTPVVSVVIPVLDEQESLGALHRRVRDALQGIDHELVFVDDGSTDSSREIVAELAAREPGIVLVVLSRNFGMEIAMSAGLDHASGDYVVLMHADLQDPPELVPDMLAMARDGADVVYARRIGREESWLKRHLATAFYTVMARLARTPFQGQAGDFRLISRRVVDALRKMPEHRRFLRGMVAWVGYDQVPIEYRRAGRTAGRGASYRALFRLASEAITSFSDVPLALATVVGTAVAVVSGVAALAILVATVAGWVTTSLGVWTIVVILFLGGVQLISVGILGRYLARVHDQTLGRPLYLVSRVVRSPGEGS